MKKAVFGLAKDQNQADAIVVRLQEAGFSNEDISILFSNKFGMAKRTNATGEDRPVEMRKGKKGDLTTENSTKAPEGSVTGGITGGVIGGAIGLLAGIGAIAIPGLGAFIAAGPIMATLGGSAVGGSLGLLVGALVGLGIPEYEAKKYESHLKEGNVLLCVHCENSQELDHAKEILKNSGAKDISSSKEKVGSNK